MKIKNIPENTLERLIIYLKTLENLEKNKIDFINSEDLAKSCGVNSAQLRKDLNFIGSLGTKGVGYNVRSLKHNLKNFLGRSQEWNLILGGLSPLGIVLLQDKNLPREGFYFLAVFDTNEENIGKIYNGVSVYSLNQLSQVLEVIKVDIAVITAEKDPELFLNKFLEQKIRAILNLSNSLLYVENSEVKIENFFFSIALTKLTYFLKE